MLKRITITLGLLGCSTIVLAGAPGNSMVAPVPSGVDLEAPDSISAWSFGIEALYVQPTGSNFQYAGITNSSGSDRDNQSVDPDYAWGGEADITYHFAGSSRDVMLAYTHLDTGDSDTTTATGTETLNSALFLTNNPDQIKGSVDNDYNAADLVFGQQLLIGSRVVLHPFIGARFAAIDMDDKVTASSFTDSFDTGNAKFDSDFDGAGPRAGIDLRILSNCGLSLVGSIGGSLLVGSEESRVVTTAQPSARSLAPAPLGSTTTQDDNDDTVALVPELDARVGINYTPHKLFPAASMGFELGYQVVHYFNVAQLNGFDTLVTNSVDNQSDFGYQGPYFRLQLNIA